MRFRTYLAAVAVSLAATTVAADPVFLRFMVDTDPVDRVILTFWTRAEAGDLDAAGYVDLGTMLFARGFLNDAKDMYRLAAKLDTKLAEPWFRLGVIEHQKGDERSARRAFGECLERSSGHGWCNFFTGLIDEQRGSTRSAIEHYEAAFRHAPELADPKENPQVLYSTLALGAMVTHAEEQRVARSMPVTFLDPGGVGDARTRALRELGLDRPAPAPAPPVEEPAYSPPPEEPVVTQPTAGVTGRTAPAKAAPAPAPTTTEQPRRGRRPANWRDQRRTPEPSSEQPPAPTPEPDDEE